MSFRRSSHTGSQFGDIPVRPKPQDPYDNFDYGPRGPGLKRSSTEPAHTGFSPAAVLGTVAAEAAVGAYLAYHSVTERDSRGRETMYHAVWGRSSPDGSYEPRGSRRRSSSAAASERYGSDFDRSVPRLSGDRGRKLIGPPISYKMSPPVAYETRRPSRPPSTRSYSYDQDLSYRPERYPTRRSKTMADLDPVDSLVLERERGSRRSSRRGSTADSRHDSVLGASYRVTEPMESSMSQATTIKPSRRGSLYSDSPAKYVLPPSSRTSKAGSRASIRNLPPPTPMPGSADAYYLPPDTPNDYPREYDDQFDDLKTIVPDDSISCINLSQHHSRSSRYREEARADDDRGSRASARMPNYHGSRRDGDIYIRR